VKRNVHLTLAQTINREEAYEQC